MGRQIAGTEKLKDQRLEAAMQEMQVQSLSWEGPLEEETAIHSSVLA